MFNCLSLFTDPIILHNEMKKKKEKKINIDLEKKGDL